MPITSFFSLHTNHGPLYWFSHRNNSKKRDSFLPSEYLSWCEYYLFLFLNLTFLKIDFSDLHIKPTFSYVLMMLDLSRGCFERMLPTFAQYDILMDQFHLSLWGNDFLVVRRTVFERTAVAHRVINCWIKKTVLESQEQGHWARQVYSSNASHSQRHGCHPGYSIIH